MKTIIDTIKVASFIILPFIVYSLLLKLFENISGEMFVKMVIIASIIFAIIIKIKIMKGE